MSEKHEQPVASESQTCLSCSAKDESDAATKCKPVGDSCYALDAGLWSEPPQPSEAMPVVTFEYRTDTINCYQLTGCSNEFTPQLKDKYVPLSYAQALQQQITNLQTLLTDETAERMRWMKFNEEKQQRVSELEQQSENPVAQWNADIEKWEQEVVARVKEFEQKISELTQECDKAKEAVAEANRVRDNAHNYSATACDKISRLESQVAELTRQLGEVERKLQWADNAEEMNGVVIFQVGLIREHFDDNFKPRGNGMWRMESIGKACQVMEAAEKNCCEKDNAAGEWQKFLSRAETAERERDELQAEVARLKLQLMSPEEFREYALSKGRELVKEKTNGEVR